MFSVGYVFVCYILFYVLLRLLIARFFHCRVAVSAIHLALLTLHGQYLLLVNVIHY